MATAKKTATVKKKPVAKKPKLGRPPRAGKAASESVRVRLTEAERAEIDAAAKRAGQSLATFMRDASLSVAKKSLT